MTMYCATAWRAKVASWAITLVAAASAFGQAPAETTVQEVLPFAHLSAPRSLNEVAAVIRSIGGVRQLRMDASSRTLTVQDTVGQVKLAEWLLGQLDQPATAQHAAVRDYQMPGTADGVVRIFQSTRAESDPSLQELTTLLRTITDIPRMFAFSQSKAVVVRGTAEQLAMAEWLFNELERKADSPPVSPVYHAPQAGDNVVRVFYLKQAKTIAELQENVKLIRQATSIRRLFAYNVSQALAVRGTADQVAEAERLIKERYQGSF